MAAHSSILAWRVSVDSGAGRASPWGRRELGTTEATLHTLVLEPVVTPQLLLLRSGTVPFAAQGHLTLRIPVISLALLPALWLSPLAVFLARALLHVFDPGRVCLTPAQRGCTSLSF